MNNWQTIIHELEQQGYTVYKISLIVGKKWNSVKRWKEGSEPKYSDGERLIKLWSEVTKQGLPV